MTPENRIAKYLDIKQSNDFIDLKSDIYVELSEYFSSEDWPNDLEQTLGKLDITIELLRPVANKPGFSFLLFYDSHDEAHSIFEQTESAELKAFIKQHERASRYIVSPPWEERPGRVLHTSDLNRRAQLFYTPPSGYIYYDDTVISELICEIKNIDVNLLPFVTMPYNYTVIYPSHPKFKHLKYYHWFFPYPIKGVDPEVDRLSIDFSEPYDRELRLTHLIEFYYKHRLTYGENDTNTFLMEAACDLLGPAVVSCGPKIPTSDPAKLLPTLDLRTLINYATQLNLHASDINSIIEEYLWVIAKNYRGKAVLSFLSSVILKAHSRKQIVIFKTAEQYEKFMEAVKNESCGYTVLYELAPNVYRDAFKISEEFLKKVHAEISNDFPLLAYTLPHSVITPFMVRDSELKLKVQKYTNYCVDHSSVAFLQDFPTTNLSGAVCQWANQDSVTDLALVKKYFSTLCARVFFSNIPSVLHFLDNIGFNKPLEDLWDSDDDDFSEFTDFRDLYIKEMDELATAHPEYTVRLGAVFSMKTTKAENIDRTLLLTLRDYFVSNKDDHTVATRCRILAYDISFKMNEKELSKLINTPPSLENGDSALMVIAMLIYALRRKIPIYFCPDILALYDNGNLTRCLEIIIGWSYKAPDKKKKIKNISTEWKNLFHNVPEVIFFTLDRLCSASAYRPIAISPIEPDLYLTVTYACFISRFFTILSEIITPTPQDTIVNIAEIDELFAEALEIITDNNLKTFCRKEYESGPILDVCKNWSLNSSYRLGFREIAKMSDAPPLKLYYCSSVFFPFYQIDEKNKYGSIECDLNSFGFLVSDTVACVVDLPRMIVRNSNLVLPRKIVRNNNVDLNSHVDPSTTDKRLDDIGNEYDHRTETVDYVIDDRWVAPPTRFSEAITREEERQYSKKNWYLGSLAACLFAEPLLLRKTPMELYQQVVANPNTISINKATTVWRYFGIKKYTNIDISLYRTQTGFTRRLNIPSLEKTIYMSLQARVFCRNICSAIFSDVELTEDIFKSGLFLAVLEAYEQRQVVPRFLLTAFNRPTHYNDDFSPGDPVIPSFSYFLPKTVFDYQRREICSSNIETTKRDSYLDEIRLAVLLASCPLTYHLCPRLIEKDGAEGAIVELVDKFYLRFTPMLADGKNQPLDITRAFEVITTIFETLSARDYREDDPRLFNDSSDSNLSIATLDYIIVQLKTSFENLQKGSPLRTTSRFKIAQQDNFFNESFFETFANSIQSFIDDFNEEECIPTDIVINTCKSVIEPESTVATTENEPPLKARKR